MIHFNVETLSNTCGVGVFYNFTQYRRQFDHQITVASTFEDAGCGWYVAGFVDTPDCRQAYEELSTQFPIVYQSPVRINANSNREFFFCVFDTGEVEQIRDEDEVDFDEDDYNV